MPPVGCKVYELPSLPVTITPVAFAAVTVNVEEFPEIIDVGFAVIVTAGTGLAATVTVAVAEALPPAPVAVAV